MTAVLVQDTVVALPPTGPVVAPWMADVPACGPSMNYGFMHPPEMKDF